MIKDICIRKNLVCISFLMLYPDLNKNNCMWYDCKTHLSTENNYKITPADK